jgi:hypothetical protein
MKFINFKFKANYGGMKVNLNDENKVNFKNQKKTLLVPGVGSFSNANIPVF